MCTTTHHTRVNVIIFIFFARTYSTSLFRTEIKKGNRGSLNYWENLKWQKYLIRLLQPYRIFELATLYIILDQYCMQTIYTKLQADITKRTFFSLKKLCYKMTIVIQMQWWLIFSILTSAMINWFRKVQAVLL